MYDVASQVFATETETVHLVLYCMRSSWHDQGKFPIAYMQIQHTIYQMFS